MEKAPSSVLFAGLRFDKRRFADDIDRFKPEEVDEEQKVEEFEALEPPAVTRTNKEKKRKRKEKGSAEIVEGFSVFKSAVSGREKIGISKDLEADYAQRKKDVEKQIEPDAILRKKYGIHISGRNVASPLQSFAELSSKYGCKSYLLRNLAELGIKEPTPIQRQTIPVLLLGRECFACAPTGSGKTLAFLCPILMKIKPGSKDGIKAIILCPTRELAAQTTRECKKLTKGRKFYIKLMTKELSRCGDFEKMPCDILVSTPFRLEFAIRKRKLDLSSL